MLCCLGLGSWSATDDGARSAKAYIADSHAHRVPLTNALQQWCDNLLEAPTVQPDTRYLLGRFEATLQSLSTAAGAQGGSIVLFCGDDPSHYDLLEVAACGSSWPWAVPAEAPELSAHTGLRLLLSKSPILIATHQTPKVAAEVASNQQHDLLPALGGQAVRGGDVLLAALSQRGSPSSTRGVLALRWGAGAGCTLRQPELDALARTAQLLAYSILADALHIHHLCKVCELLHVVSRATTLREIFSTVLTTSNRLLQACLGIEVQLVMALTHGPHEPPVFIVPKADDDSPTLGMIMAGSKSIDLNHAAHRPHGARHGAHMPTIGAGQESDGPAAAGPGVRAVLASPAMTVLQQLLLEQAQQLRGQTLPGAPAERIPLSSPSGISEPTVAAAAGCSSAVQPCYSLIPQCSSHVLDDTRPGRDVVLCQKLLQAPLQSMAVCLCPSELMVAVTATDTQISKASGYGAKLPALPSTSAAGWPRPFPRRAGMGTGGLMAFPTTTTTTSSTTIASSAALTTGTSTAAALRAAGLVPPAPHWAFYLCSSDRLPVAVLKMLADEMVQVMQLVLPTLSATLVGPLATEWALLGRQLMVAAGQPPCAASSLPGRLLTFGEDTTPPQGAGNANAAPGPNSSGLELSLERAMPATAAGQQGGDAQPAASTTSHHGRLLRNKASAASDDVGMPSARSQSWTTNLALAAAAASGGDTGSMQERLPARPVKSSLLLEALAPASPLDLLISSVHSIILASAGDHAAAYKDDERAAARQDLAGLELFEVIGRGGQGLVFRGSIHGLEAAVKVMKNDGGGEAACDASMQQQQQAGASPAGSPPDAMVTGAHDDARMLEAKRAVLRGALELAITSSISHPSIVQLYAYFTDVAVMRTSGDRTSARRHRSTRPQLQLAVEAEAAAAAGARFNVQLVHRDNVAMEAGAVAPPLHTLLCLEYCDAGTLLGAAKAGAFRQAGASATAGAASPSLVPLYTSLLEVALALRHLHGKRLVHGDVKAANVLLKSNSRDPRGWACKLSDFGCVRILSEPGPDGRMGLRQAQPIGTLPFMAPEMFVKGALLDSSIDVYAFGIMMWELLMCRVPLAGIDPKVLPARVVNHRLRPNFHPLTPPGYSSLASLCWSSGPGHRPGAIALVAHLQALLGMAQREEAMLMRRRSPAGQGPAHVTAGSRQAPEAGSGRPAAAELQHRTLPAVAAVAAGNMGPGGSAAAEVQANSGGRAGAEPALGTPPQAAAAPGAGPECVPSMSHPSGVSPSSGPGDDTLDPAAVPPAVLSHGVDTLTVGIKPTGLALRVYLQRHQMMQAGAAGAAIQDPGTALTVSDAQPLPPDVAETHPEFRGSGF